MDLRQDKAQDVTTQMILVQSCSNLSVVANFTNNVETTLRKMALTVILEAKCIVMSLTICRCSMYTIHIYVHIYIYSCIYVTLEELMIIW